MWQVALPEGLSFQLVEICVCWYSSVYVKYWACRANKIAYCVQVSLVLFHTIAVGIVKEVI